MSNQVAIENPTERDKRRKRLRNLAQYRNLSDEELDRIIDARDRPGDIDPRDIIDLPRRLPPSVRSWFRQQVEKILSSLKTDINPEIMRARVEHHVFLDYIARKILISMDVVNPILLGDRDTKAIDNLENRLDAQTREFAFTPKERRKAGAKTDAAMSEMLSKSSRRAQEARGSKDRALSEAEKRFGGKALPERPEGEQDPDPEAGSDV